MELEELQQFPDFSADATYGVPYRPQWPLFVWANGQMWRGHIWWIDKGRNNGYPVYRVISLPDFLTLVGELAVMESRRTPEGRALDAELAARY